jgi:hypothetical protein
MRCAGIKANSERCRLSAIEGSDFCANHDPARAEERRKNASKGGKSGGRGMVNRTAALWDEVRALIEDVQAGRLTPSQGNTVSRFYGILLDLAKLSIEEAELAIEERRLALDVEERTELKRRMDELEEALGRQEERRAYRAY